jgi:predicted metalloprotease with PDZ domain
MALLCVVFCAAVTTSAQRPPDGDTLPRRAWFGVALGPHDRGAVVTAVTDGSSAAAAGVRAGDVIQAVDDRSVRTPEDVIRAIGRHVGGEVAAIELLRDGRSERQSVALRSLPREALPGVTFEYGSVVLTDGTRLRTIVSVPDRRGGPLPADML